MSFGSQLKTLRLENKLTQSELAEKINLSKANVSKYEADLIEPNFDTLIMLSDLFNVSADYLLDIPDKKNSLPDNIQALVNSCSNLNEEELKKVSEYVDFLKVKRQG